jgi:hypothetical protein
VSGRRRAVRLAIVVVAVVLAFMIGVAFSRSLDERPKSSGAVTTVRTLTPLPESAPTPTETVTVTVTSP